MKGVHPNFFLRLCRHDYRRIQANGVVIEAEKSEVLSWQRQLFQILQVLRNTGYIARQDCLMLRRFARESLESSEASSRPSILRLSPSFSTIRVARNRTSFYSHQSCP